MNSTTPRRGEWYHHHLVIRRLAVISSDNEKPQMELQRELRVSPGSGRANDAAAVGDVEASGVTQGMDHMVSSAM